MPHKQGVSTYSDLFDKLFDFKGASFEFNIYPTVKRIIYNVPTTVVYWSDKSKTVVKCEDGKPFDKCSALCWALAKKVFGSTSNVIRIAETQGK